MTSVFLGFIIWPISDKISWPPCGRAFAESRSCSVTSFSGENKCLACYKLSLVIFFSVIFAEIFIPEQLPFSYAPRLWELVHTPLLRDQTQLQMHHICQLFLLHHYLLQYKSHHLRQPRHTYIYIRNMVSAIEGKCGQVMKREIYKKRKRKSNPYCR